jgi:hypothetical protein
MIDRTDEVILEKLRALTPERRAEVEDFIDFLRARLEDEQLTRAAMLASEPALKQVWDNSADAIYDDL